MVTGLAAAATFLVAVPVVLPLGILLMVAAAGSGSQEDAPSAEALADIPGNFLTAYQEAAAQEEIDWAILAGIGKLECDHGRSQLAGCDPPGSVNGAGARGPMQFLGSTWRADADPFDPDVSGPSIPRGQESRGYATDGDGDGIADPWNLADATHAAARYLRHSGAPEDYSRAIFAYNRSENYVRGVMEWADTYRDAADADVASGPNGPVELIEVRGIVVNVDIASAVEALLTAAERDGIVMTGSGYRDPEEQIQLRRQHCGTSSYAIYEMPSSRCSPPTARPGTSMHEVGLAVDFSCQQADDNGQVTFQLIRSRSNPCYTWLTANAARFGLYELSTGTEPWHWSVDGS